MTNPTNGIDDPLERRLARLARAAGYVLVPIEAHRNTEAEADAVSAVCIAEARRMRAALDRVRSTLATAQTADELVWLVANIVEEALTDSPRYVVPPESVPRLEVIRDHSPEANT